MINILKSENLKYRRTFMRKLIIFAPLFFVLYALPQKIFMPANYLMPWQLLIDLVYNWWPVIFIPIGLALYASLVA
ncbi:MAG: lantibiotic immunity ABC transporter MutE/EpiE family permease subunit, partial [Thermoanaerobacterium sp.]|nr:lantibiotic immunity ABC transporter MutE/EpiE family permease subunit [Thermoanaerobacterium sp.]